MYITRSLLAGEHTRLIPQDKYDTVNQINQADSEQQGRDRLEEEIEMTPGATTSTSQNENMNTSCPTSQQIDVLSHTALTIPGVSGHDQQSSVTTIQVQDARPYPSQDRSVIHADNDAANVLPVVQNGDIFSQLQPQQNTTGLQMLANAASQRNNGNVPLNHGQTFLTGTFTVPHKNDMTNRAATTFGQLLNSLPSGPNMASQHMTSNAPYAGNVVSQDMQDGVTYDIISISPLDVAHNASVISHGAASSLSQATNAVEFPVPGVPGREINTSNLLPHDLTSTYPDSTSLNTVNISKTHEQNTSLGRSDVSTVTQFKQPHNATIPHLITQATHLKQPNDATMPQTDSSFSLGVTVAPNTMQNAVSHTLPRSQVTTASLSTMTSVMSQNTPNATVESPQAMTVNLEKGNSVNSSPMTGNSPNITNGTSTGSPQIITSNISTAMPGYVPNSTGVVAQAGSSDLPAVTSSGSYKTVSAADSAKQAHETTSHSFLPPKKLRKMESTNLDTNISG